jgi:hypothetical protein
MEKPNPGVGIESSTGITGKLLDSMHTDYLDIIGRFENCAFECTPAGKAEG